MASFGGILLYTPWGREQISGQIHTDYYLCIVIISIIYVLLLFIFVYYYLTLASG